MTTFPEQEPAGTGEPQQVAEDALLADVAEQVDGLEAQLDLTPLDHPRRLLLVHAHPDDETVATGTTMARYAAGGDLVVLLTCTRGELGEVVAPELAALASAGPDDDRLGEHRVGELAAAMEALGVREHRFLGGPGRWRDSGMAGESTNDDPRCFWRADAGETTGAMASVIRTFRPQVVITYDANGAYGHPDHIQAHRVTMAGVAAAADPAYDGGGGEPWQVARVLATALPRSAFEAMQELPDAETPEIDTVPDAELDFSIDGTGEREAKLAAMRAHRSQIDLHEGMWSVIAAYEGFYTEHYVVLTGEPPTAKQTADLFEGLV